MLPARPHTSSLRRFSTRRGPVRLAFNMFAGVALPAILSATSAEVASIYWGMSGFQIACLALRAALGSATW
jgi:hypothetical protein